MKANRDAIYDHHVSKNKSEDHGGADRQIYSVDEGSYSAFCTVIEWEDPQSLERPGLPGKAPPVHII